MKSYILALALLSFSEHAVSAENFDPRKYGLVPDETLSSGSVAAAGFTCEFLRDAVEGPKKVWQCSDGTQRYAETNLWARGGTKTEEREVFEEIPDIELDGGILLTIEAVATLKDCTKSGCRRYPKPSFSYLRVKDREECDRVAPGLAARQYVRYRDLGVPVRISFDCGPAVVDTTATPMFLPRGMIMGYPYTY